MQSQSHKRARGFTIVEVMVAFVIFAIVSVMLVSITQYVQYAQRQSIYTNIAYNAANAKITEYQNFGYDLLEVDTTEDFSTDPSLDRLPSGKTAIIEVSQPSLSASSKELTVTITYPASETTKKIILKAYVQENEPVLVDDDEDQTPPTTNPISPLPHLSAGFGGISFSMYPYTEFNVSGDLGDVYTHGALEVSGGILNARNVIAVNKGCGNSSTFPQDCTTFPVTVGGGLGPDALHATTICGRNAPVLKVASSDDTATGDTTTSCDLSRALPKFDKEALTGSIPATNIITGNATCSPSTDPLTLKANYKYTGNVTLQQCSGQVTGGDGVIYIEGNLSLSYGASLSFENSITKPITFVVNGTVTFDSANTEFASGLGNSLMPNIISFKSSNATCSSSPTCNELSNSDLYASKGIQAIYAFGTWQNIHANLYAPFGKIKTPYGSTDGAITAKYIYGQTVELGAVVNFVE